MILLSGILLFWALGHYALWDDESYTALSAKGVLKTGDTTALIDHNIVAYANGSVLSHLKDHYSPPLPAYLTAPFLKLFGERSALAARLPFALFGMASIVLMAWWLWISRASPRLCLVFALGLLGNVSLFLYLRQSRYYAIIIFCALAMAFVYFHWKNRPWEALALSLAGVGLFASNYMIYVVVGIVFAADYFIWGRKGMVIGRRQWLIMTVSQIVGCGAIALIWNPFTVDIAGSRLAGNSLYERLTLLWWNFRDLNQCEFAVFLVLGLSPFLFKWKKRDNLMRAVLAVIVYVILVTLCSPQTVKQTSVADVRYLVTLIPLFIYIQTEVILRLIKPAGACVAAAILLSGTNLLHGTWMSSGKVSSTFVSYLGELASPPSDPYTEVSKWINAHLKNGDSVWVLPDYAAPPLIFHAPDAQYAWQLEWPPKDQFKNLPLIHFRGREAPDYIIAFGPVSEQVRQLLAQWQGVTYKQTATLDIFWKDVYRPELFWRSFHAIRGFDPEKFGVVIFERMSPQR